MSLDPGSPAPDFTLATADGDVRLADFTGRKLVLYFYPKDDTPGCTTEAVQFTGLADRFAAADTQVIGVSKDSLASHARFAAKHSLGVTLGSDPDGAVISAYGAWVQKSMYGKTYMGIERATVLIGRDGHISEVWRKVKVPGHAEAVLRAAEALG
jgi:peroxiredoxin Q/BCP